jgi:hypothetical protein
MQRDGIHFQGQLHLAPTSAPAAWQTAAARHDFGLKIRRFRDFSPAVA